MAVKWGKNHGRLFKSSRDKTQLGGFFPFVYLVGMKLLCTCDGGR